MKIILLSVLVFLVTGISAIAMEKGEICVSRGEDNGVLNIRPAQITANEKHLFWISGGERKCVTVKPGKYRTVAQSSDPYDPNDKNATTWKSQPLTILVKKDSKVIIYVTPGSQDTAYVGSWKLKK